MKEYTRKGQWTRLTAKRSKAGIILENQTTMRGDVTGIKILFKGENLPVNDDELFRLWDIRDTGKILAKGTKVQ